MHCYGLHLDKFKDNFLNISIFFAPSDSRFSKTCISAKPYINGKPIHSAFGWCIINLNFEKLTLMTGFVVQGHKLSISTPLQIVSSVIHFEYLKLLTFACFCYRILVLFEIFQSYFDLNRCLLTFCDIKLVHFDRRSVCCPAMSCSTMWTPRSWKC